MDDLIIELMNEYGKDFEDLPEDFDNQAYLSEKAKTMCRPGDI
jgi:hypothetical protein